MEIWSVKCCRGILVVMLAVILGAVPMTAYGADHSKNITAATKTTGLDATVARGIQVSKEAGSLAGGEQTVYPVAARELAVVNFKPAWGKKSQNVQKMKKYIYKAYQKGVKILVFPELCVTGYVKADDIGDKEYKMIVRNAEFQNGITAKKISALSLKYQMWVIYGAPEKIRGDRKHAYNSAFVCDPDGKVKAYQKVSPVEGKWCKEGKSPLMIDTKKYGKFGLSICHDTYCVPELARYYAAKGCSMLINPTAAEGTGDFDWWYRSRLESGASRDGMTVLSANLVGEDGSWKQYRFPGGSVILQASDKGAVYYAGVKKGLNRETDKATVIQNREGMFTNTVPMAVRAGSISRKHSFRAELYAKLYQKMADRQTSGKTLSYYSQGKKKPKIALGLIRQGERVGVAKKKMLQDIKKAGKQKVEIIVFPELALDGTGESLKGGTVKGFCRLANKYKMYIIFGMREAKGGKYYNSAVVISPAGKVSAYHKIHLDDSEEKWATAGDRTLAISTKWGKAGILIGEDGEDCMEQERYYGAMGCTFIIHLTNTKKNTWYTLRRIGSFVERDRLAAITCSTQKSQSMIITNYGETYNGNRYDARTGSYFNFNGTGPKSKGDGSLVTAKVDLNECGFGVDSFRPGLFASLYRELSRKE